MSIKDRPNIAWTKEMENNLREMIAEKKTGSQIADILSAKYKQTFTRNSVIGKANRLNVSLERKVSAKPKDKKAPKKKNENKIVLVEKPTAVGVTNDQIDSLFANPYAKPTELLSLQEGQCKYPQGDVRDGTLIFCGAPADSMLHRSYCSYCYDIVYYPASRTLRSRYKLQAQK